MKKAFLLAIVCFALICTVSAADKSEIFEMWKQLKPSFSQIEPYQQKPSDTEEWKTGELKEEFITDGVNYINFCRFVAGLPQISYNSTDNDNMQKAVLLYSASVFSDTPTQPAYMEKDFYDTALDTLGDSLTAFGFDTLDLSVAGLINSRSANMQKVVPRTTLLNPHGGEVSMGFFNGYSAVKFTQASEKRDFDFVSWPSGGYFPSMLYKENLPWTITLNPEKYSVPSLDDVTVRMENLKTNDVFELKADGEYSYFDSDAVYIGCNPDTYTYIFKPDTLQLKGWFDYPEVDVRITVFGIYTADMQETSLRYTVKFFNMDDVALSRYSDAKTIANHHKTAVADMTASGVFNGYPDGTFRPQEYITRAEFTAALLRYMKIQPSEDENIEFSDVPKDFWAKGYIDKAAQMGAVNGTAPGVFSPHEIITVQQAMKIITIVKGFASKMDVEASGGYPTAYYNMGVELGILDYIEDYQNLELPLARTDVAQIFYNTSDITDFWLEHYKGSNVLWHRSRSGKAYGYYTFIKFK